MPVCLSRVWTEEVVWSPVRGLSASVRRAGQDRPAISVSLLYNSSNCSDLPSVIGQQFSYLKRNRVDIERERRAVYRNQNIIETWRWALLTRACKICTTHNTLVTWHGTSTSLIYVRKSDFMTVFSFVSFLFFLKGNIWDKDIILKWNITQNFRSILKHDANLLWVFPLPQMKMTAVQTRAITAVCAWTWWTPLNASVRRSGPERRVSLVCVSSLPLSVPPLQQCAFPSLSLSQGVFVQKSNFRGNRVRFGRI